MRPADTTGADSKEAVLTSQHAARGTDRDGIERRSTRRKAPAAPAPAPAPAPAAAPAAANTPADPLQGLEDDGAKIRVAVRTRPPSRKEVAKGDLDIVQTITRRTLLVHEPKEKVDLTKFCETHRFTVDDVYDHTVSTEQLYRVSCAPLVSSVFEGAACTCFAYGQTGSGKTFTMMGDARSLKGEKGGSPGVYMLAARDIFACIESRGLHGDVEVLVSYFEIYGNKLFDLLGERRELRALEDAGGAVNIVGLSEQPVDDTSALMDVIAAGNAQRSTGSTAANLDSSRSHAVLQLVLRTVLPAGATVMDEGEELGRFSFIDLAGSERGADTGASSKKTRMEGAEINKSLLALKECIRSLYLEASHLPFRGSKLTQVLKDSFVGTSRTVMIATISPNSSNVEHSLNTLRYAYRVKEIQCEDADHAERYQPPHGKAHELPGALSPNQLAALVAGKRPKRGGRRRVPAAGAAAAAAPASAPVPAPVPAPAPAPAAAAAAVSGLRPPSSRRPTTSSDGDRRRSMAGDSAPSAPSRPVTSSGGRRSSMGGVPPSNASVASGSSANTKPSSRRSSKRSSLGAGAAVAVKSTAASRAAAKPKGSKGGRSPAPAPAAVPAARAAPVSEAPTASQVEALPAAVRDTVQRHLGQVDAMRDILRHEERLAAAVAQACTTHASEAQCEGHLRAFADSVEDLLAEKLALIDALAQDIVNLKRRRGWLTPTPSAEERSSGASPPPQGMWEGGNNADVTPQMDRFVSPVRGRGSLSPK